MSGLMFCLIGFLVTSVLCYFFYQLPQSLRGTVPARRWAPFKEGQRRVYHPAFDKHRVNKLLLYQAWNQ